MYFCAFGKSDIVGRSLPSRAMVFFRTVTRTTLHLKPLWSQEHHLAKCVSFCTLCTGLSKQVRNGAQSSTACGRGPMNCGQRSHSSNSGASVDTCSVGGKLYGIGWRLRLPINWKPNSNLAP